MSERACEHPEQDLDYDIGRWRVDCLACGQSWSASKGEIDSEMNFRRAMAESRAEDKRGEREQTAPEQMERTK